MEKRARDIDCGQGSRARLWIGELPEVRSKCGQPTTQSFPAEPTSGARTRSVAVEILLNTGPRWLYGLLGAEFRPHDSFTLDVTICTDDILGETFEDAMALESEEVWAGLLPEYGEAVEAALSRHRVELQGLGAGTLVFRCAAHGKFGSAWVIFHSLASTLVVLLTADQPVSDELVKELLLTRLREFNK